MLCGRVRRWQMVSWTGDLNSGSREYISKVRVGCRRCRGSRGRGGGGKMKIWARIVTLELTVPKCPSSPLSPRPPLKASPGQKSTSSTSRTSLLLPKPSKTSKASPPLSLRPFPPDIPPFRTPPVTTLPSGPLPHPCMTPSPSTPLSTSLSASSRTWSSVSSSTQLRALSPPTPPFATRRTSPSRTSRRPLSRPPSLQSRPQPRLRAPSPLYLQQPPSYSSLFPTSKQIFRWTLPSSLTSLLRRLVSWNRSATPISTPSSTKEAAKSGVPKTSLLTGTS